MTVKVEFKKSDKSAQWDDRFESILDLAEEQGRDRKRLQAGHLRDLQDKTAFRESGNGR